MARRKILADMGYKFTVMVYILPHCPQLDAMNYLCAPIVVLLFGHWIVCIFTNFSTFVD